MPIWNNDNAPINLPLPTMGGKVFWEELDKKSGYTLQKHKLEGHCRLLNADSVRVAWGTEEVKQNPQMDSDLVEELAKRILERLK